jgi:hypothetical protein
VVTATSQKELEDKLGVQTLAEKMKKTPILKKFLTFFIIQGTYRLGNNLLPQYGGRVDL